MAQSGCASVKDSEKYFELRESRRRGHPNRLDLVLYALTNNIYKYSVQARSYDMCIAPSDCDFEVEDLGLTATAFELPVGV